MLVMGTSAQVPEIQADGLNLVLQPASGGVVHIGGTDMPGCNSSGLCGLLNTVSLKSVSECALFDRDCDVCVTRNEVSLLSLPCLNSEHDI